MAPKYYTLTEAERALGDTELAGLIASLDTEQTRDQAEKERLEALLAPVKERLADRGLRLMALEQQQESRAAQAIANAAADKARTRLERDIAAMLANPSQVGKALAGVLQAIIKSDWWGKRLGLIVDAREDDDSYKVVVFSGRMHATISILPDGYDIDTSTSDNGLISLIGQIYGASEQQLRKASGNHIGFRVKPTEGARVMAAVANSAGWGQTFVAFDTNPQLAAQIASEVITLLNSGTIKVGNGEIPRQAAGGAAGGYTF